MARRGRTAAADRAPDGVGGAPDGAEHPGARTMGAIALRRWMSRGPDGPSGDDAGAVEATHGPFDEEDLDPEHAAGDRVDFGAIRIPLPRGGEVSVEPEEGRLQAVHVMLPTGRLSVSALAAPRTARLWPDLAAEIDESLREGGATVRSYTGEWGRELHARTGEASSVFVGVDGPRWMLYGVATGPTDAAPELDAALRWMLHDTVVVRGRLPYPVRTVLPLTVPEEFRGADVAPAAPLDPPPAPLARPHPAPAPPPAARRDVPGVRPEPSLPPPPAARRDVPGPPVPRPAAATRSLPPPVRERDDRPTEPYGLPRTAAAVRDGSSAGAGRPAPARAWTDGPGVTASDPDLPASPARPPRTNGADTAVSTTGQHTVADLLARAERERAAAAGSRTPPVDPPARPRNGRPYGPAPEDPWADAGPRNGRANGSSIGEPPGGGRNGRLYGSSSREPADDRPRNGNAYGSAPGDPWADAAPRVPVSRDAFPAAHDLDPPPRVRFPDVGVAAEAPVDLPPAAPRVDPAWSAYPAAESRPPTRPEPAPIPAGDGSDDWTVPMAVVPPAAGPDVPDGGSDLWAGDPWAVETRRIAREARAALAASEPVPSPDPVPEEPWRRRPPDRRPGHRAPGADAAEPGPGRAAPGEHASDRLSRHRPAHQRPAHQRPAHGRPGADDGDPTYGPPPYQPSAYEPSAYELRAYRPSAYEPRAYEPRAYEPSAYEPSAYAPRADSDGPPARTPAARAREARTPEAEQPWSGRHRRPER